jgi:hypothetical protein
MIYLPKCACSGVLASSPELEIAINQTLESKVAQWVYFWSSRDASYLWLTIGVGFGGGLLLTRRIWVQDTSKI